MKVLFVCTGNVFRSLSAEYCLRDYATKHDLNDIEVSSAGIRVIWEPVAPRVKERLKKHGILLGKHKQTKLSADHISRNDLVVAMNLNHQKFIKESFGKDVPLFNEIAYGEKTGVLDINEVMRDWFLHPKRSMAHIDWTIDYIYDAMPSFIKNMGTFVK